MTARGAIGRVISYQSKATTQTARQYSVARGRPTTAQKKQRALYRRAITAWSALTETEKITWARIGDASRITGYNMYLRAYLLNPPPAGSSIWDAGATTWDNDLSNWD